MSFSTALAAAKGGADTPDALEDLARAALAEAEEEAALALVQPAAERLGSARLWQWTGLLHRSLGQLAQAMSAFAAAARIAPADALIAHGRARAALEAGVDARPLFDEALRLSPGGEVWLGWCAAHYAVGEGALALDRLAGLLAGSPQWAAGHVHYAQLAAMCGRAAEAMATVEPALARSPADPDLWVAAIQILNRAERFDEAWRLADRAIAATRDEGRFALIRAAALSDSRCDEQAALAFARLGEPRNVHHAVLLARQLVRAGNWRVLGVLADRWMQGDDAHLFWPYAAIAWRQAGDPRWEWLEGQDGLVQVLDLGAAVDFGALAADLRRIHARSGRFLDQSVRGGTQTDGPLFSRIEPAIRQLRAAVVTAVEEYRAKLPPPDPTHPMLRRARDRPVRFAGSWSVRLSGQGFHSQHVHPQGWISSALYVDVPAHLSGSEGWLTLGEPQPSLGSGLQPFRTVEPRIGRLVLFPSMMWHGTVPFAAGERLTTAFDVAPPR